MIIGWWNVWDGLLKITVEGCVSQRIINRPAMKRLLA